MMRTSWIYNLKKDEPTAACAEFGLEAVNTVEEMRKALRALACSNNPSKETIDRLEELESKYTPRTTLTVDDTGSQATSPRRATSELMSSRSAMDRVRKWSVKYDEVTNPLEFIQQIEELCGTDEIPLTLMPKIMIELFTGQALMWYRNNRRPWADWQEFKKDFTRFFLHSRFFERLDDQIRQTYQQQGETFKAYALRMQNLMRHTEYTLHQKINRIYRNSRREYQLFIGQTECGNLTDMISLAEHSEDIPPEQSQAGHHRRNGAVEPKSHSLPYDGIRRRNVCHRCAQEGHYTQHCQNPRILFGWECGRRGILTKDCCRVNGQIRPQFRGMDIEESPDTYERTPERPESPELRIERSSVIANVTVDGLLIKGVIDTEATRTIIKSNLQDVIPFVSEAPIISTKIRKADGTLRFSHRELVATVRVGETHFQLPLLVLDDVVGDLTLGMDFLIKAQATLVIGERAIQFGSTVKRPKDPRSGKPFDTISNSTYGVARGPASKSIEIG
uniref:CCHC-type domain-containing protein n=1 Tax=Glossina austeni TaxID=7395 RepID=A0A1A9UYT9_GLOAU